LYMPPGKNLTIGITVNLDNYENVRLEVNGDAEKPEDAAELITFLDGILGGLGRGDDATAERIDSYRKRVLTFTPAIPDIKMASRTPADRNRNIQPLTQPGRMGDIQVTTGEQPGKPGIVNLSAPSAQHGHPAGTTAETAAGNIPAPGREIGDGPGDASRKDAGAPVQCEECGVMISETERKMSLLFSNRILCRKCLRKGG
jgi:hypothetical protein